MGIVVLFLMLKLCVLHYQCRDINVGNFDRGAVKPAEFGMANQFLQVVVVEAAAIVACRPSHRRHRSARRCHFRLFSVLQLNTFYIALKSVMVTHQKLIQLL